MKRRLDLLSELREDIVRAAYAEGDFVLTGGLRRNYYFDKYLFETRPAILRRLSRFLAELVPRITFTFGGVRVDTDARVLDRTGRPIVGLCAAGELVGGLFYHNYPGGSGLMAGSVFGRRAGYAAASSAHRVHERHSAGCSW